MFRSLRTGKVIDDRWLRFSFPTFWHYDILRGLDYLRNAGSKPDRRVSEAIEIVIKRRHQNGRWPLNLLHSEPIPVPMETAIGSASRWNTLRALRVLRWSNNGRSYFGRLAPCARVHASLCTGAASIHPRRRQLMCDSQRLKAPRHVILHDEERVRHLGQVAAAVGLKRSDSDVAMPAVLIRGD
jgi:hypothetical protein